MGEIIDEEIKEVEETIDELAGKDENEIQDVDKRVKSLQNQVKKIQYLIENSPFDNEHKTLNRMLKVRFDEIDRLKKMKKVSEEIKSLEKKLIDLKKMEEKLLKTAK